MTDRRQARLLTDPRSAGFIHPFLGRERSTAEAAHDVGCALTTMAYRVRILKAAGLLIPTRTEPRAGRPITYYRSSQDAYEVPLTATEFLDQEDQTRRIGAPIYRRLTDAYSKILTREGAMIRSITRDDQGSVYSTDQPPHRSTAHQPLIFEDRHVYLTRTRAERLCAELDRLVTELAEDEPMSIQPTDLTSRQQYLIMVAAVPVAD